MCAQHLLDQRHHSSETFEGEGVHSRLRTCATRLVNSFSLVKAWAPLATSMMWYGKNMSPRLCWREKSGGHGMDAPWITSRSGISERRACFDQKIPLISDPIIWLSSCKSCLPILCMTTGQEVTKVFKEYQAERLPSVMDSHRKIQQLSLVSKKSLAAAVFLASTTIWTSG